MEKFRAHIFIYGDVTGVGFRSWTKSKAEKLGLTGWVKNVSDSVEAVLEGEKEKIDQMIKLCHEGPETSWVERVDEKWEEYIGEFEGFEII